MGLLGSLFKRKKDDLDLGLDTGMDSSINHQMSNPLGDSHMSDMGDNNYNNPAINLSTMNMQSGMQGYGQQQGGGEIQKDLQIISLKLDTIKSELDSMSQRLRNLESIAEKEQRQPPTKRWY